jgi:Zn-dependent protease
VDAVLLSDPGSTSFDLRFRLFGTPVRVHPLFWVVGVFLSWGVTRSPRPVTGNVIGDMLLCIGCIFVSILLHEFGHVWAFRAFGNDAHVVLHGMGGLAIPDGASPRRWQRIVVSAAGPAIQLVLFAAIVGLIWASVLPRPPRFPGSWWLPRPSEEVVARWLLGPGQSPLELLLGVLLFINLVWPLFNLLPIWPLDGGQISREVCEAVSPPRGLVVSLWISLIVCILLAVNEVLGVQSIKSELGMSSAPLGYLTSWLRGGDEVRAIFFALFAVGSYQALQAVGWQRRAYRSDDDLPWER